jgi:hypothetical protein
MHPASDAAHALPGPKESPMETFNAISKVRFSSARPQRVQLQKLNGMVCDLLCLEPAQELSMSGRCAYYVIAGQGVIKAGKLVHDLTLGCFAATGSEEHHSLHNDSEQRLICLAISIA